MSDVCNYSLGDGKYCANNAGDGHIYCAEHRQRDPLAQQLDDHRALIEQARTEAQRWRNILMAHDGMFISLSPVELGQQLIDYARLADALEGAEKQRIAYANQVALATQAREQEHAARLAQAERRLAEQTDMFERQAAAVRHHTDRADAAERRAAESDQRSEGFRQGSANLDIALREAWQQRGDAEQQRDQALEQRDAAERIVNQESIACAYCSFEIPAPAEARLAQAHVLVCEFNPITDRLRAAESRLETAEHQRDKATAEIRRLTKARAKLAECLRQLAEHDHGELVTHRPYSLEECPFVGCRENSYALRLGKPKRAGGGGK